METTRPLLPAEQADKPDRSLYVAAAILVVVLLAATLGLWARYGSDVFIDLIAAGWAACFG